MQTDLLLTGISQLATYPDAGAGRGAQMASLTVVDDAAMAFADGRIAWIGRRADWSGEAAHRLTVERQRVRLARTRRCMRGGDALARSRHDTPLPAPRCARSLRLRRKPHKVITGPDST